MTITAWLKAFLIKVSRMLARKGREVTISDRWREAATIMTLE